jgi:hypothetical protein
MQTVVERRDGGHPKTAPLVSAAMNGALLPELP